MVTSASVPQKVLLEYVAVALHKEPDPLEDTEGTDSDNFETFASDVTVHEGNKRLLAAFHTALYFRNIQLSMENTACNAHG